MHFGWTHSARIYALVRRCSVGEDMDVFFAIFSCTGHPQTFFYKTPTTIVPHCSNIDPSLETCRKPINELSLLVGVQLLCGRWKTVEPSSRRKARRCVRAFFLRLTCSANSSIPAFLTIRQLINYTITELGNSFPPSKMVSRFWSFNKLRPQATAEQSNIGNHKSANLIELCFAGFCLLFFIETLFFAHLIRRK